MKIRTFLLIAVFAWLIALVPAYFILRPLYITIDSEYFLTGFFMLALSSFIILEYFNRERLNTIVKDWIKDAFVFDLTAMELVYLKHQRLEEVIHGYVSHLVEDGKIEIEKHNHLKWVKHATPTDAIEYIIAESVKESGDHGYRGLIYKLKLKPAIVNIAASMEGLKKYFIKSKMFSNMFSLNFVVLSLVLMLGMVRMITGIMREKPVGILFVMLVAFICLMVLFLKRLSSMMTSSTIPGFYTEQIAPEMQKAEHWDWAYFMMGSAVLAETFMPVYRDIEGGSYGGGGGDGSSGSSCGSGCGSSCGGGCGGCGGG